MTDEDLAENERMWKEESGMAKSNPIDAAGELRTAGVSPTGIASDAQAMAGETPAPEGMAPEAGAEGAPAEAPAAPPA
jgi:hypothetical protein